MGMGALGGHGIGTAPGLMGLSVDEWGLVHLADMG